MLADAHVRAVAEGDVLVRPAVDPECVGIVEHLGVAVGRLVQQHQPVTLLDLASVQRVILGGLPGELLDRGRPAQRLVEQVRDERKIILDPLELVGMQRELLKRSRERARRRVVTGGGDRDEPAVGEPLRIVLAVLPLRERDDRGEVVLRVLPPVLHQHVEVGVEVPDRRGPLLRGRLRSERLDILPARLGVLRAEELLAERHHPRLVLLGHAEKGHDDVQRVEERELPDEVDIVLAGVQEPGDDLPGELADGVLPLLQVRGAEPFDRDVLDRGVLRRVKVGERVENAQAATGEVLGELVTGLVLQNRVVRARLDTATAGEDVRLPLDLHDVGMPGDQPDRIVARHPDLTERIVLTQPLVGGEQPVLVDMPLG